MNLFKYTLLIVSFSGIASTHGSSQQKIAYQNGYQKTIKDLIKNHAKPGIATSGSLTNCMQSGRTMLSLWDKNNKTLYFGPYYGAKNLKAIKATCPACIDTTHLTSIRDYKAGGWFYFIFGKKITQ
ncbi:MAG: hypothetical protein P4L31_06350 [Candidatus Babeliales bacterium]|nr:hypothetical protein [Candidatus Babeliales bacterium]